MPTARYYREDRNPGGVAHFPGVPHRDITEEEWESYPPYIQAEVDASEMYQRSRPRAEKEDVPAPAHKEEKRAADADEPPAKANKSKDADAPKSTG